MQMNYFKMILSAFVSSRNVLPILGIRRKPKVLQLPVTSRCNSRCVTCNVWKEKKKIDIDPALLKIIFSDEFFSEVCEVGINGGEITLVPDFIEIINAVMTLPRLKTIYLISNGLLPDKLLDLLGHTKKICDQKGVYLNITISVDGYGDVHEMIRGIPHCFIRTKKLLDMLFVSRHQYAHGVSIGCTLSQKNIPYVIQTESFLSQYPFPVQYHIAVPNKRIHTFGDAKNYYLLDDEHSRLLGAEFFYKKFTESSLSNNKYFYFSQYYFLKNKGRGRLCPCQYKYRDITIDEQNKLYLCATASEEVGDLSIENIHTVINKRRLDRIQHNTNRYCDTCVHYMDNTPTLKGMILFLREIIMTRFNWVYKFELLARW